MILKRFYDEKLAAASYLVGCAATGEALIVDPLRDVEPYLSAAAAEHLRITDVTETHIHADFVSGARELAERTGAVLRLSGEGGPDWRYEYAEAAGAVLLRDGDSFRVGSVRVDVRHTPGHTPEHLSFVITDTAGADRPMGVFTGDFVFVGDVGRPDLLERAAQVEGTMDAAARDLFRSLQRFRSALPDYVQLWPGHGAGSACGKALGAVPQTTLGYERLFNWAFGHEDEDAFVRTVLADQPEPPKYFAEMKRINRAGPHPLHGVGAPEQLPASRLAGALSQGVLVVDTRSAKEFGDGFVPGTINIPLNRAFNTWAGWLIPYHRDFHLIISPDRVHEAVRDLAIIGLDRVAGYFAPDAVQAWREAGHSLETIPGIRAGELAARLHAGEVAVVDVRGRAEWEMGHLPDAPNIPVGYLSDRLGEIPRGLPVAVHCMGGVRSAIAASLLRAHGIPEVLNMSGGYPDWVRDGNPIERSEPAGRRSTGGEQIDVGQQA